MSWPGSTKLSLVGNVALLGIVGYSLWALKHTPIPEPPPPRIITSTVTQIAARKIVASNFWAALAAHQTPSWSNLESTNYTTYIENLRSIGCPDETIQDIIIADVAKVYAKKRAALRVLYK